MSFGHPKTWTVTNFDDSQYPDERFVLVFSNKYKFFEVFRKTENGFWFPAEEKIREEFLAGFLLWFYVVSDMSKDNAPSKP